MKGLFFLPDLHIIFLRAFIFLYNTCNNNHNNNDHHILNLVSLISRVYAPEVSSGTSSLYLFPHRKLLRSSSVQRRWSSFLRSYGHIPLVCEGATYMATIPPATHLSTAVPAVIAKAALTSKSQRTAMSFVNLPCGWFPSPPWSASTKTLERGVSIPYSVHWGYIRFRRSHTINPQCFRSLPGTTPCSGLHASGQNIRNSSENEKKSSNILTIFNVYTLLRYIIFAGIRRVCVFTYAYGSSV